jgi:DNA-binding NarL/FixJ family response regulator
MARLQILVADDHTLVRQGLRRIIEEHEDWEVVAEAQNGREAVERAIALEPDVVVLDIGMPLLGGIEAARQIIRKNRDIRVIMLSMHLNEAYVTRSLQAGASGYLLKDSADVDLQGAIAHVAGGASFFSPAVTKVMLDDYVRQLSQNGVPDRYDALSAREREVFQLLAEGKSNKEVAAILSISVLTVETHRAHILQKLDVHNSAEIVLFAVRRGLVS